MQSWRLVVNLTRTYAGTENVAFLWAPNSGNGYPFGEQKYSADINSAEFDRLMDTNQDGKYDIDDDPYTPFYPGDEWVDWVGFSVF